jgi:methionyl-tRNA formyltransferase
MTIPFLYITCAENGLFGLRNLYEKGYRPSAVVTIPPALGKRHAVAGYTDVAPWCEANGVPCIVLSDYQLKPADLRGVSFELLVINGWNRLISAEVLALAKRGGIGIHAGHPPIGLGRAPLVWNLLLGHKDVEVYVFVMTPNADDGAILALRPVEITPYDDVRLLYQKVMFVGAQLIEEAISRLASDYVAQPQNMRWVRHYEKRGPEDGLVNFSWSEQQIYNFVRAQVPPYPGAFAYLGPERWTILKAQPFDCFAFRDQPREPGRVVLDLPSGPVVLTGGAPVWITHAEVAGSKHVYDPGRPLTGRLFGPA